MKHTFCRRASFFSVKKSQLPIIHFMKLKMQKFSHSSSFSLVELLVVISIFAILISLLSPSLKTVLYNSQITECKFKLKNITTGVLIYADDFSEHYPDYGGTHGLKYTTDSVGSGGGMALLGAYTGLSKFKSVNDVKEEHNQVWRCPQEAPGRPTSGYGSNRKSYATYFNMFSGTNAHYQKTDRSQLMVRVGDLLTMSVTLNRDDPTHWSRPSPLGWPLSFNVLASDTSSTWYQHTFNHKRFELYDTNFALDDGSVHLFREHRYSLNEFMRASGDSWVDQYCLPHSLGVEL
jgi:hypothetical protein